MVELDLENTTVTLAVAQRPFETESESGIVNSFSTLRPLLFDDGRRADPVDFPHNGDVWWMIRGGVRGLAEPGRLITGVLEASAFDRPARPATRSASIASRRPAPPKSPKSSNSRPMTSPMLAIWCPPPIR